MSGEDSYDPGPICWDFRQKCWVCGKQVQYTGGQRVQPDCGHPENGVEILIGPEETTNG